MLTDTSVHPQEFKASLSMLLKPGEKTYTQRCRLFIGNLPNDITEENFKKLFAKYGEPSEVFINKGKCFGFIRLVRRIIFFAKHRTVRLEVIFIEVLTLILLSCRSPVRSQRSLKQSWTTRR